MVICFLCEHMSGSSARWLGTRDHHELLSKNNDVNYARHMLGRNSMQNARGTWKS